MQRPNLKVLAGSGLILWAVGLQIHMWRLRKRPDFAEKFPEAALPSDYPETHTSIRFGSPKQSEQ